MKPFILTRGDRLKLHKRVLALLSHGRQRAIRGSELARRLGEHDDRKIRLIIRELISEGIPVASSVSEPMGFFIVSNEHEAGAYIRVLKERIREDQKRLQDFETATSKYQIPEQLELVRGV